MKHINFWIIIVTAILVLVAIIAQASLFYDSIQPYYESYKSSKPIQNCHAKLHTLYPEALQVASSETEVSPILIWLTPITDTITNTLSYPVHVGPFDDNIYFTDKEGLPVVPQIQATTATTSLLFIRQIPLSITRSVVVSVSLQSQDECNGLHTTMKIRLEDSSSAKFRYLLSIFFGTTTSVLAIVAFVGNLLVQSFLKYQEQAQKRQEQLQQTLQSIQNIKTEVISNPRVAVQDWHKYFRQYVKTSTKLQDGQQECVDALDNVAGEIAKMPSRFILLKKGICEKDENNLDFGQQIFRLLHDCLSSELLEQDEDTERYRIAVDLLLEDQPLSEIYETYNIHKVATTLIWLYQEFDLKVQSVIESNLLEACNDLNISLMSPILKEFAYDQQIDLRAILVTDAFDRAITDLNEKRATQPQDIQDAIDSLTSRQMRVLQWPKPWPDQPEYMPRLSFPIGDYLEKNNFSIDTAELEPNLYPYYIPWQDNSELHEPTANITYGKAGDGKTTSAFYLYQQCVENPIPSISHVFPIYWGISPSPRVNSVSIVQSIQSQIAEHLIQFFALNPRTFLECSPTQKTSITTLLIHHVNSMEVLTGRLELSGLGRDNLAKRFVDDLHSIRTIDDNRLDSDIGLLKILKQSLPAKFNAFYLIVDVAGAQVNKYGDQTIADFINNVIEHSTDLIRANIYPKFFLPDTLQELLFLPSYIKTTTIEWSSEQMTEILKQRLIRANDTIGDLNRVFDIDPEQLDINQAVITAAQNSPRKLIQLVDRLIRHTNRQNGIDAQTIQQMLKHD